MRVEDLLNLKKQNKPLDLTISNVNNRIFVGDNPFLDGMRVSIIEISTNDDIECIELTVDYNKFLDFNKDIITKVIVNSTKFVDYFDFDDLLEGCYHVDKEKEKCSILIDISDKVQDNPFKLINASDLELEYQESNFDGTYLEFLEKEVIKARLFK